MEEIVAFKKKMQCQKCEKSYSANCVGYMYAQCYHHSCATCFVSRPSGKCPICTCSTDFAPIPFMGDVFNTLKAYEALQNRYTTLKQENVLLVSPPDHHKCIECDELNSDKNMQLCKTCHELKFEDHEDVKKNALCAGCAIKKHMRQGHQTVDFFPYFSAYNFSSQSPKINSNLEEFKSARNVLSDTFTRFNALSNNVSENYDLLTEMAQRSKNTKHQVECFEKMEKFISESKSVNVEADSELKERVTKLENNLTEIKEWYESRLGDCVDESEIVKLPNSEVPDKNDTEVDA